MPYFASSLDNFTLSWDVGVLVFLFFVAFFYGLSLGRRKLVLFLASLYFGLALIKIAPYIQNFTVKMSDFQKLSVELGLFLGILSMLFYFFSGSVLRSSFRVLKKDESPWWHVLLLSFATAGFLTASILDFFPSSYYNKLSTITREIFLFNNAHFWWAVVGVVVLMILRRKKKE